MSNSDKTLKVTAMHYSLFYPYVRKLAQSLKITKSINTRIVLGRSESMGDQQQLHLTSKLTGADGKQ
jgi:hypothetical protein